MNEINLIKLSIQDFFTKEILRLALLPFVLTIAIMGWLFFSNVGDGIDTVKSDLVIEYQETTVENGIPHTTEVREEYQGSSILEFLLTNKITSGILEFIIYTLGTIAVIMLSIFISVAVIGFFTPFVIKIILKRHYPDIEQRSYGSVLTPLWVLFKTFITMLGMFILFIPLYFIPMVNIIAFNLPMYYFFHKMIDFDVSSSLLDLEEYGRIKMSKRNSIRTRTFLLYVFSLIPLVGILFPLLYIIYVGHGYIKEIKND